MNKRDVCAFAAHLEDNLFTLREQLLDGTYQHDSYTHFYVHDPKRRFISKATVKDRIVHQALVLVLEPLFEQKFIFDSYASRRGKGAHAAVERLGQFFRQSSANYRHQVYFLKCDIKKFYDSVRHDILMNILIANLHDERLLWLVKHIVDSYTIDLCCKKGLPLGNATSQLFTNIYLNEFDHFVKERLRRRWYIRFCDDFVMIDNNRTSLESDLTNIQQFLLEKSALELHPKKIQIRKGSHGIDFVGQILRPHYRVLRTQTKRRLFSKMRYITKLYRGGTIEVAKFRASLQSYLGVLSHGSNTDLRKLLKEKVWRGLDRDI